MFNENAAVTDSVSATAQTTKGLGEGARGGGVFKIQCFDKDGNLKWEDKAHNLVVNVGLQDMNDKYFSGSAYTASWYLGLVTGPGAGNTYAAGDTLGTHLGWSEFTDYSGNRKLVTFGGASLLDPSVIDNSGSPSQFVITGTPTNPVAGAFLTNVATGTSGILFSVSNFQSPGDRTVVAADTLNVTYEFSLDAA